MGRTWIALALVGGLVGSLGACSPLYGDRPERLHNPERRRKPPEAPDTGPVVKYIEDCQSSMSGPIPPHLQPAVAANLINEGDQALQQSQKATDPASAGNAVKEAVDKYRNALTKDPYNTEATVKLAEAYDLVQRKGCALAMLRRLAQLSNHPKFQKSATPFVDEVADNPALFKGYRKDAVNAVGR